MDSVNRINTKAITPPTSPMGSDTEGNTPTAEQQTLANLTQKRFGKNLEVVDNRNYENQTIGQSTGMATAKYVIEKTSAPDTTTTSDTAPSTPSTPSTPSRTNHTTPAGTQPTGESNGGSHFKPLKAIWRAIGPVFKAPFEATGDLLNGAAKAVKRYLPKPIVKVIDKAGDWIGRTAHKAVNWVGKTANKVGNFFKKLFHF